MKILFYCFIICFVIVSCKALPEANYKKLLINQSTSREISEVIRSDNYFILPLNVEYRATLLSSDSILRYLDDGQVYYSNYKLFKCNGDEGKTYKVTTYGFCDCFGFRKYMFNSKIVIIDNNGKLIDSKLVKNETILMTNQNSNTLPFHTDIEWEYRIPTTGEYMMILFSDNKIIGSDISGKALIDWPIFKMNIYGDFMITIQEK